MKKYIETTARSSQKKTRLLSTRLSSGLTLVLSATYIVICQSARLIIVVRIVILKESLILPESAITRPTVNVIRMINMINKPLSVILCSVYLLWLFSEIPILFCELLT